MADVQEIVIGNKPLRDYVYVVFSAFVNNNEVVLSYIDLHANKAEMLAILFKKSFGVREPFDRVRKKELGTLDRVLITNKIKLVKTIW